MSSEYKSKREIFKTMLINKELTVETGLLAKFANGSVLVRYGDTVVLVTVTASKMPKEGIDFFPLSVEYEERQYAVGKIPGSYTRREGRPSDREILISRVIDRSIRPLFPKGMRNSVVVSATVLSMDQDSSPELASMIGTSIAMCMSDIPFNGPIGCVILGLVNNEVVMNPIYEQRIASDMYITLTGTRDKITMIEAGAKEVPEEIILDAIKKGHVEIKKIVDFIDDIVKKVGKTKFEYTSSEVSKQLVQEVSEYAYEKIEQITFDEDKQTRDDNFAELTKEVSEHFGKMYEGIELQISEAVHKVQKQIVRENILNNKRRVDGRGLNQIRPLSAFVGILPRTHGSAIFQRGDTQVLTIATLGASGDVQFIDGISSEETTKKYMHHYNFPPYSVGEARSSRGPSRRDIGHGALAEKALEPVIPSHDVFPYTIRLVSEVTASNGSTSQGSVCASTLALMDAGVPITAPVAGISVGLVTNPNDSQQYEMLLDILGMEDFFGDMDFKVAGTKKGITAIQVDIKIDGLSYEIIETAFNMTTAARIEIIDEVILATIDSSRGQLSEYAPKIYTTNIDCDKIRDVIGPGGKTINEIILDTGVKIDIEDTGKVFVLSADEKAGRRAISIIESLGKTIEIGEVFLGKVTKVMPFGAFVKFLPGKEGLVHISKLSNKRVEKIEDVVRVGEEFLVKVLEIDKQGKINLSRKDALS